MTQEELVSIVGVKQSAVYARKKQGVWPEEWACRIGERYNLLTKWILTGKGIKTLRAGQESKHNINNEILSNADIWLSELLQNEPWRKEWFRGTFEDAFPAYKTWLMKKD